MTNRAKGGIQARRGQILIGAINSLHNESPRWIRICMPQASQQQQRMLLAPLAGLLVVMRRRLCATMNLHRTRVTTHATSWAVRGGGSATVQPPFNHSISRYLDRLLAVITGRLLVIRRLVGWGRTFDSLGKLW